MNQWHVLPSIFLVHFRPVCVRHVQVLLITTLLAVAVAGAHAADALLDFADDEQAALYLQLTKEYRCLKCQNQNLADSNAALARDLRNEIYQQVIAGKTEKQISTYLVARYGDFVLYKPPFKASTYLLWLGPFLLLLVALIYVLRLSKRSKAELTEPGADELSRAQAALDD